MKIANSRNATESVRLGPFRLYRVDRDLVGELGIVFGKVDDEISGQSTTHSIGYARDFHGRGFALAPIHAPGRRRDGQGGMRIRRKGSVKILKGHARGGDGYLQGASGSRRGHLEVELTIRYGGGNEFHSGGDVGIYGDPSRHDGIGSEVFQTGELGTVPVAAVAGLGTHHSTGKGNLFLGVVSFGEVISGIGGLF